MSNHGTCKCGNHFRGIGYQGYAGLCKACVGEFITWVNAQRVAQS